MLARCVHRVCTVWSVHTKQELTLALAAFRVFVDTGDGFTTDRSLWIVRLGRERIKLTKMPEGWEFGSASTKERTYQMKALSQIQELNDSAVFTTEVFNFTLSQSDHFYQNRDILDMFGW